MLALAHALALALALALAAALALAHCRICTGLGPSLERTLPAGHCWQNSGLAGVPSSSEQDRRLRGVSCTRAVTAAVAAVVTAHDPRLVTALLVLSHLKTATTVVSILPFPPLPAISTPTPPPPTPYSVETLPQNPHPPPTLNRPRRELYTKSNSNSDCLKRGAEVTKK